MQAQVRSQAFDGFVENGFFYPAATLTRLQGRFKAVLTVIDVPETEQDTAEEDSRMAWLDEFMRAVRTDPTPKLRMEDFPRMDFERAPVIFADGES